MIDSLITPELIGCGIVGLLGWAYAWVANGTVKDIVGASQTFARMGATFLKIKEDGKVTTEESEDLGELTVAFFEELEAITGKTIFNDAKVPFVLPKQMGSEPDPIDVAATIQQVESLLKVLKGLNIPIAHQTGGTNLLSDGNNGTS